MLSTSSSLLVPCVKVGQGLTARADGAEGSCFRLSSLFFLPLSGRRLDID